MAFFKSLKDDHSNAANEVYTPPPGPPPGREPIYQAPPGPPPSHTFHNPPALGPTPGGNEYAPPPGPPPGWQNGTTEPPLAPPDTEEEPPPYQ